MYMCVFFSPIRPSILTIMAQITVFLRITAKPQVNPSRPSLDLFGTSRHLLNEPHHSLFTNTSSSSSHGLRFISTQARRIVMCQVK